MALQLKLLAETTAPLDEIAQILRAEHGDPFHILGMHLVEFQGKPAVAIRAFLPRTHEAWVVRGPGAGEAVPLRRIHADGFFEAVFPGEQALFPYRLRTDYAGLHEFEDPYRFPPVLSDFDLHLLAEGTHYKTYEKLGAHLTEIAGVPRRVVRGVGAECLTRERGGQLQPLGRPATSPARARLDRRVGNLHSRSARRRDLQV